MKKIKTLSLVLLICLLTFYIGCIPSFSKFKAIMNEKLYNATISMEVLFSSQYIDEGEKIINPSKITIKIDGDRIHIVEIGEPEIYIEKNIHNEYQTYEKKSNKWYLVSTDNIEYSQYNIDISKGDFNYTNGVWVGNEKKLKNKVRQTAGYQKLISRIDGEVTFLKINKYDITIENNKIKKMIVDYTFDVVENYFEVKTELIVYIEISDYRNTKVIDMID